MSFFTDFGNPGNMMMDSMTNAFDMFQSQPSIFDSKAMKMTSDIMETKMQGLANVMEIIKNKSMLQHVCLLTFNILLDMLEQSMEIQQGTVFDSAFEVLRLQLLDSIQRTKFE